MTIRSIPLITTPTPTLLSRARLFIQPTRSLATLAPDLLFPGLLQSETITPADEERMFGKYAEKLRKKGIQSISDLKKVLTETESKPSSNNSNENPDKPPQKPKPSTSGLPPTVKSLSSILNVEKISELNSEQISLLWTEYFAGKKALSGVIPADFYVQILERAKKFPVFVLPLPRDEGFEFFYMQFQGHQIFFTSLLEYQTNKESARPYLTVHHYTDLIDSKNIVLMMGEVTENVPVTLQDGQFLMYLMQEFYVTGSETKRQMLEAFHRDPAKFNYQEMVEMISRLE